MRLIVLGAGLMGVTSAWALWRDGHEVVVLERAGEPAAATSHANAGLVSASRALPWPAPGLWRRLVRGLVDRRAPWQVAHGGSPRFWRWGARLVALANAADHARLARAKLAFAEHSHRMLRALIEDTGVECAYHAGGLVYVCRSAATLDAARARSEQVACHGVRLPVVSAPQLARIEPALAPAVAAGTLVGASYAPGDAQGDARAFTIGLAAWLAARGVVFRHHAAVTDARLRGRRLTHVVLATGEVLACDGVVAALGPYGDAFAQRLGVTLPIHPVKGFSLTVPVRDPACAPRLGGICEDTLVAWCPLDGGRRLRLTTGAIFGATDTTWREADFAAHREAAERLWPGLLDWHAPDVERWACLRPMTPSSLPLIDRGPLTNLWWNTGQGHIGWTMCAGSAQLLADQVAGRAPSFPVTEFERLE